jgi:hypothetical protein
MARKSGWQGRVDGNKVSLKNKDCLEGLMAGRLYRLQSVVFASTEVSFEGISPYSYSAGLVQKELGLVAQAAIADLPRALPPK